MEILTKMYLKMHIFCKKSLKSAPEPPLAFGGWGLRPKNPMLLLQSTDVDLFMCVSSLQS